MKTVFIGTAAIAEQCLRHLVSHNVVPDLVVTRPDAKKGRNLKLAASHVKQAALELSLPLHQPLDINAPDSLEVIAQAQPDLVLVVAYGQILGKELLSIPRLGCINLHTSLLPQYRGASPIVKALLDGANTTGVTTIFMNEAMDEGDMILRKELSINSTDDFGMLYHKLTQLGQEVLLDTCQLIEQDKAPRTPQDHSLATYAPKQTASDRVIPWEKEAKAVSCHIRAFSPAPGAHSYVQIKPTGPYKMLKIFAPRVIPAQSGTCLAPGQVIKQNKEGILIATGKDYILATELQLEGKQRMTVEQFTRGTRLPEGCCLLSKIA